MGGYRASPRERAGGLVTDYTFETITTAQALSFDSNFDTLVFTAPGSTASNI